MNEDTNSVDRSASETLISFGYISTACRPLEVSTLDAVLRASRAWNTDHGVTGILLYNEGSFMQLLEGTRKEVRSTFEDRIRISDLHENVIELFEMPIEARSFSDWAMACKRFRGDAPPAVLHAEMAQARHTALTQFWSLWD